jgi:hypothetical protein
LRDADELRVVELVRMFEAFGIEPTASRLDLYLEVLGAVDPDVLHDGVVRALREPGNFPPAPGNLRAAVLELVRERERVEARSAPRLPDGVRPEEAAVFREFQRRIVALPRDPGGELRPFSDYFATRKRIADELASDLHRLAGQGGP